MMILNGTLALLQCLILPGWLVLRIGKLRAGMLERLIWLMPLSMVSNYLLIFLLTLLGLYTAGAIRLVMACEGAALLWLYRAQLRTSVSGVLCTLQTALRSELQPIISCPSGFIQNIVWFLSGCGAISAVLWGLHLCRLRVGTVFSGWDTLFSWNTYAQTWAGNELPLVHGLYPQLVPANWSISYVLTGDSQLQLFNTLIPPLFFLLICLMFFDLGFQKRSSAFFIAAIITRYMLKKLMGDQLFDGYMDVPAACMCLLSVYCLLKAEGMALPNQRNRLFLAMTFACAAAITKQIGFCAVVLCPLLMYCWLQDAMKSLTRRDVLFLCGTFALLILPWYGHCLLNSGDVSSAGSQVVAEGIIQFNRQYEWSHKVFLARQSLGIYAVFFALSWLGLPFIPRRYRLPFFLLSWPLTLIWVAFYTYDTRNLASALPFVALSCGFAITGIGRLGLRLLRLLRFQLLPVGVLLILLLAGALFTLSKYLPDEKLLEQQRLGQRDLFGAELNQELLYNNLGDEHSGNDILTDYPAYFLAGYRECCSMIDFKNTQHFEQMLQDERIRYLLSPMQMDTVASAEAASLLEACISSGHCQEVSCSTGYYIPYCLYEVK